MASILKVDEMQGVTAAGDITITTASITMQLQTGIAKAFHGYGDQAAGALNANSKTLNISSYVDTGTGRSRLNITSAFDAQVGQMINGSTQAYDYGHYMVSSTLYESANVGSNANYVDGITHAVVFGDLA